MIGMMCRCKCIKNWIIFVRISLQFVLNIRTFRFCDYTLVVIDFRILFFFDRSS